MTEDNRRRNCRLEWGLGQEAWEDAELLVAGQRWRAAIARYYFAAFHSARAAVLARGLEPRSHAGVKSSFSQQFVHSGQLEPAASRVLSRLETERADADYSRESIFAEADAVAAREMTRALREPLLELLRSQGWLD